jgi:IPT/TIG domain-containing protein
MTSAGVVTTLHSFQGSDGAQPYGPVSQDTSGNLYGTATNGTGNASQGTAFLIATGLHPFVSFIQNRGNVSKNVGILGRGLEGTVGVYFGKTAASFKVISDTYLVARVPVGATTAFVTVVTATESLKSNVPFQVLH